MDHASIAASHGSNAGKTLMNKPVILAVAVATALTSSAVCAQSAPLRGMGLLALEASDTVPSARRALVESPDGGGGGIGARAQRGSDGTSAGRSTPHDDSAPDALPPKPILDAGDPTPPAAATPKRPSYRWQSLVPGAIK